MIGLFVIIHFHYDKPLTVALVFSPCVGIGSLYLIIISVFVKNNFDGNLICVDSKNLTYKQRSILKYDSFDKMFFYSAYCFI